MKYRKKPIIIEAIKWDGLNVSDVNTFCGGKAGFQITDSAWQVHKAGVHTRLYIATLEGELSASVGDYIIKGVHGELYPCKPDIFEETYEPAE